MSYTKLSFTKNWGSETDFPRYEESETQVRADLQELHDQTKNYLNKTLLPELEAEVFGGRTFLNKNVLSSAWTADSTYDVFPYRADVSCPGVTEYDVPIVTFNRADADSNKLAPLAYAGTDVVRIYASEALSAAITIPSIFCVKGGS